MKYIEVNGFDDFGAEIFENSEWFNKKEELWNKANEASIKYTTLKLNENTEDEVELCIMCYNLEEKEAEIVAKAIEKENKDTLASKLYLV